MRDLLLLAFLLHSFSQLGQDMSIAVWFDSNREIAQIQNIGSSVQELTFSTDDLDAGWHKLHYQTYDNTGHASAVMTQAFFLQEGIAEALDEIVIWFNNDLEGSFAIPLSQTVEQIEINYDFQLPEGWHLLSTGIRDGHNHMSQIRSKRFYVTQQKSDGFLLASIWFDENDSTDQSIIIPFVGNDSLSTFNAQFCMDQHLDSIGDHAVHFKFVNDKGMSSEVTTDSVTYQGLPCDAHCISDINGDNFVDIDDFILMNTHFYETCEDCPEDIDGDGLIDMDDLDILLTVFNQICIGLQEESDEELVAISITQEMNTRGIEINPYIKSRLLGASFAPQISMWSASGNTINLLISNVAKNQLMRLTLLDISGAIVHDQRKMIDSGRSHTTLQLDSPLSPGLYVLRLKHAMGTLSEKIVYE